MEKWLEEFNERLAEQLEKNQEKWGAQDPRTLLGVLMEEVGELATAVLEFHMATNTVAARSANTGVQSEAIDAAAVCADLARTIEKITPTLTD